MAISTPIAPTSTEPSSPPTEIPIPTATSSTENTAARDVLGMPRWSSV